MDLCYLDSWCAISRCSWAPCSSVTNTALHPPTVQLLTTNISLWSEQQLMDSAWICVSWCYRSTAASDVFDVCGDKMLSVRLGQIYEIQNVSQCHPPSTWRMWCSLIDYIVCNWSTLVCWSIRPTWLKILNTDTKNSLRPSIFGILRGTLILHQWHMACHIISSRVVQ